MLDNSKWMRIQAYKHNGSFHRMWSHGYVLHEDEDYYVVVSVKSKVNESDKRVWHTKEPALFILSKKEWFNVIAMIKEKGITYYVNIASPCVEDNHILKYIDYDLDVKLLPTGNKKLLDINEFNVHSEALQYNENIKKKLYETVKDIYDMMDNKTYPFNDDKIKELFEEFNKKVEAK